MPVLIVDGHPVSLVGAALLGIVVGYLAGMFGIGGGFLMTPLLVTLFDVPLPIAVGTGLCQMIGTSLVTFLRHRDLGQGEARVDILLLPGSLVGAALGAEIVDALADLGSLRAGSLPWVKAAIEPFYVVILIWIGWITWRRTRGGADVFAQARPGPFARAKLGPSIELRAAGIGRVSSILLAYVGVLLGVLSGLLGIGGGVALAPILLYGYGFPLRQAAGTGVVVLFMTSVVGTGAHAGRGNVHLGLAMTLLVGGTISAQLGALTSRRISPANLARILSLIVLLGAAAVVWDLVRHLT